MVSIANIKEAAKINDYVELGYPWKDLWYDYICNTWTYFQDNHMEDRLLIYNLDIDKIDKSTTFFADFDVVLSIDNDENKNEIGKTRSSATIGPRLSGTRSSFIILI